MDLENAQGCSGTKIMSIQALQSIRRDLQPTCTFLIDTIDIPTDGRLTEGKNNKIITRR